MTRRTHRLVLGSASPRRATILADAGFRFEVAPAPDVPEVARGRPGDVVRRNARVKCEAAARLRGLRPGEVCLGADTIVVLDRRILGKPASRAEARRMVGALQNRWHRVVTGVHLLDWRGHSATRAPGTRVHIGPMDPAAIRRYVASGEADDKAGAYGIQGRMGIHADRVAGCYFNVVGLSPYAVREGLEELGLDPARYLRRAGEGA